MTSAVADGSRRAPSASLLAVLLVAVTAIVVQPAPAAAHDSQYCQHSHVNGRHWSVWYGAEWTRSPHYHYVDHYYRADPDHWSYNYRHTHRHRCEPEDSGSMSAASVPPPQILHEAENAEPLDWYGVEVGAYVAMVEQQAPSQPTSAADFVRRLRTVSEVRVVELRRGAVRGHRGLRAVAIAEPRAGHRLVSVVGADGGRLDTAELGMPKIVEVASPKVAGEIGH